jgi:signal transduction histidine kinase/CheY-like chemotaxis protein
LLLGWNALDPGRVARLTSPASPRSADFILTAAIILVGVLVLSLVLVLGAGARIYAETRDERLHLRDQRNALIAFTQAQTDAIVAQRSYLLGGDAGFLADFTEAKTEARTDLAAVRRLSTQDPAALQVAERMGTQLEDLFSNLDASIAARASSRMREARTADLVDALERDTSALHSSVMRRSEVIRVNEDSARRRIDSLATALALLSLVTSALAILALRRERQQWRLATEAAEEARARATASDLAKTRFLAVASHDMRQPLHALTLYLSALERRVEGAEARDIITKMDRATQSMVGMFSTLLDLARIQAGVVKAELEPVRVQDVIDRIVAEHPGSKVYVTQSNLSVHTDPVLLERMLRNLVSNAIKHGGGKARIGATLGQGGVEIVVADDGPGIAPEDQARVFDEFVRLDGRAEGLGLGLAIVKRIADLLEMPIELVSEPGAGVRFILRAPLAQSEVAHSLAKETPATLDGAAVLVVDDDPLAREAVARSLTDLGATVRSAANETEADAAVEGFAPRLLVMDLRIDGELRGVDIARRLCEKLEQTPQVIVITGDTGPETMELLRASGFPWLIKPVSSRDLSEAAAAQLRAA